MSCWFSHQFLLVTCPSFTMFYLLHPHSCPVFPASCLRPKHWPKHGIGCLCQLNLHPNISELWPVTPLFCHMWNQATNLKWTWLRMVKKGTNLDPMRLLGSSGIIDLNAWGSPIAVLAQLLLLLLSLVLPHTHRGLKRQQPCSTDSELRSLDVETWTSHHLWCWNMLKPGFFRSDLDCFCQQLLALRQKSMQKIPNFAFSDQQRSTSELWSKSALLDSLSIQNRDIFSIQNLKGDERGSIWE